MNKEMSERLKVFVGTDIMVSFYTDTEDSDSFILGFFLQMDKNYALINTIDSLGEENGFSIINMNEIFVFVDDKVYSKKIKKLFETKNQKRRYIEDPDTDSEITFLRYASSNKLLIIVNGDTDFTGYVTHFSKETLVIKVIDSYGKDAGTAVINMNNVNTLDCENKYLKTLELLTSH